MKTILAAVFMLIIIMFCISFPEKLIAQEESADTVLIYKAIYEVEVTPVKDQSRSGTCWAFGAISFVEAEILRESGKACDLSEMFPVRYSYPPKAMRYVRLQGNYVFGAGGQAHDVINVINNYGMIPENEYTGFKPGEESHNHGEMDAVLKGFLSGVVKKRSGKISSIWPQAFDAILDVYLGKVPENFIYEEIEYSPVSFAKYTGFDPDQYIEITSYNNYDYYKPIILEVPDNWSNDIYYNVPLDDLMKVMEYSFEKGYSIVWDGDVSDKGFSHKNGIAIVPDAKEEDMGQTERERWEKLNSSEKNEELYVFDRPVIQKHIDQGIRQQAFDNQTSTDDHLMHLTALIEDQKGTKYYRTKNSWNSNSNEMGGYLNMSEAYIRLKTIAIMVNKDGIPKDIAKKLGLK